MNVLDRVILSILFAGAILRPIEPHWSYVVLVLVIFLVWQGIVELCYRVYGKNIVEW